MAVNGLYNYAASFEKNKLSEGAYRSLMRNDRHKQEKLLYRYGFSYFSAYGANPERDKNEKKAKTSAIAVLKRIPSAEIDCFCNACLHNETGNIYIQEILEIIRRYGNEKDPDKSEQLIFPFMVIWLPYKVRCDSFHAEKCIPAICFRHDEELNALRVINRLLDRFLTEELLKWFIETRSA